MISTRLCSYVAAGALALSAAAPCRADLFAVTTSSPEILRIDSATGNVTQTYPFPDWLPTNPTTTLGLAFDGRVLYMNRRGFGGSDELWSLDVVNNYWYPPMLLDTFVFPPGQPQPLTGLGFLPDGYGGGTLVGVSRNSADAPPSYIFQYLLQPGFPDPFLFPISFPPGELPPGMAAQGADVDPATGDLWIAVDEIAGTTRTPRLLRTDLMGTVLETLTPTLGPATLIRGVGFDAGGLFVVVRNLPAVTSEIYEIDRTTGAVLRSFALPGSGSVGALTGGAVLPEPSGIVLAALAGLNLAVTMRHGGPLRRRRRRDV